MKLLLDRMRRGLLVPAVVLGVGGLARAAELSTVLVVKNKDGWQLLRHDKPYFIKGAGGNGPRRLLARAGGNSIRTWGRRNLTACSRFLGWLGPNWAVGNYGGWNQNPRQTGKRERATRFS